MSHLRLPAALLLACTLATACTDSDDGPQKYLVVDNQADVGFRVAVGATDFGTVAAAAMTDPTEIDNGPLALRIDGTVLDTLDLASDNVGGQWTLTLVRYQPQPGTFALTWGITADD